MKADPGEYSVTVPVPVLVVVVVRQVAYCFEDQDTEEAERLMEKNQIRRLPVLDREKCVVGIVSLGTSPSKTMKTVRERR
jgi:CBS domain-containing protein